MAYIGDEAFNLFLKKIKFPRTLPELKAYSLRYIWAIQMPRMQQIFDEMKCEYRFDTVEIAEEFYSYFMALWNLLTKYWTATLDLDSCHSKKRIGFPAISVGNFEAA